MQQVQEALQVSLVLDDGTIFEGVGFGAIRPAWGEVVFSTGIVGYPESLTDPSYRGQILVLTYPLIGNYGVPPRTATCGVLDHFESDRIQVSGLVVSTLSRTPSHWSAVSSLDEWMRAEGVPGIEGVDTRALTQRLRARGVMGGRIVPQAESSTEPEPDACDPRRLVSSVSVREPQLLRAEHGRGVTIGVLDCGVKNNILRLLLERGADVLRVPWDADPLAARPCIDGLLISNGPGDPKDVPESVRVTRRVLERGLPTFGICFGSQIMALAAGADTYKLPYGHRGQNQPCIDLDTGRCYITSQNHGYTVDEKLLPAGWEPWFRNANDGTNEGIRHTSKPFSAVQFHPEAHPGPEDLRSLVDDFLARVASRP
jgi:carbamoyl-phosphate synthase small subunit